MRLAHGLTQWQVAQAWNDRWPPEDDGAGITGQIVSYWETWPRSGREPTVRTLCRLALIYQCTISDLVYGENYGGPDEADDARRPASIAQPEAAMAAADPAALRGGNGAHPPARLAGAPAARAPVPIPAGLAYREIAGPESSPDSAGILQEVIMAAHEDSEHAESAERRDIGDPTLEQIRADVTRLSRDYMTAEPAALLREMQRVRARIHAALDRQLWPRDQTDLYFLLSCLTCLMANTASDLGSTRVAEELARSAWAYAVAIRHQALLGQLRCTFTDIAYWSSQPRQARDFASNGLEYLPAGPTAAQLHLKFGRAAARLGDADAARAAVALACEARERDYSDDLLEIGGEFRLTLASQHSLAGSALIDIPGAETDAASQLQLAADLYATGPQPGESYRYTLEARARIDLATAQLRIGELDAAAAALAPPLALPAAKRTAELPQRLLAVRAELASPRYQGSAVAAEVDQQIEAFSQDTIPLALTRSL